MLDEPVFFVQFRLLGFIGKFHEVMVVIKFFRDFYFLGGFLINSINYSLLPNRLLCYF